MFGQRQRRAICGILVWGWMFFFPVFYIYAEPVDGGVPVVTPGVPPPSDPNNPVSAGEVPSAPPPDPSVNAGVAFDTHLVLQLKYVKADQIKAMLATLMPNSQIRVEAMNSMLIVMGSEQELAQVKDIITQLDIPPRQVMFEAEIVEISRENLKNLGLNMDSTTPLALPSVLKGDGSAFRVDLGKSGYGVNIQATLNHLVQNKKGRLLASPRVAALDGQTAQIMIGDKLAVESTQIVDGSRLTTVNYIEVGIKLEVTPTVHADGTITTRIRPEVSNKTDTTASGNPNIRTRQAETMLRVKDGETIVLGGLIQREENRDTLKIPILGDIPLIGRLFRSTNREKKETELVILITPKIMKPSKEG